MHCVGIHLWQYCSEPIHRNLSEFSQFIVDNKIDCGLATDGDADRIGLYNSKGEFVDAHHIILVIHYLVKYKKMSGKVVTTFSCSVKVKKLCEFYNLEHETVKIGFKHIAGKMVKETFARERSGGITIKVMYLKEMVFGLVFLRYVKLW